MPWYAAHAILYTRFKDGKQDSFHVWENVYLIETAEGEDPQPKAAAYGKMDEDYSGTLTCDDRPAEIVFAGIRKIVSVLHAKDGARLASGDELTYSQFIVQDENALHLLVAGDRVHGEYVE